MEQDIKRVKQPLMVSIWCLAYNHEPYIRQCLEGIVMQKTNFRFEAIVHDDASTDGTAAIIREYAEKYPDIIKPIYETENQYSKKNGSIRRIMNEHTHGKYVAFCEGDDYWIDPLKLQKQVDILETHPNVSLVHTGFRCIDEKGDDLYRTSYENYMRRSHSGRNFKDLFVKGNYILTLTVCLRHEVYESSIMKEAPCFIDYLNFVVASLLGEAYYLPEKTGCYRRVSTSMVNAHRDVVNDKITRIKEYISDIVLTKDFNNFFSFTERVILYFSIVLEALRKARRKKDFSRINKVLKQKKSLIFLVPFAIVKDMLVGLKKRIYCKTQ